MLLYSCQVLLWLLSGIPGVCLSFGNGDEGSHPHNGVLDYDSISEHYDHFSVRSEILRKRAHLSHRSEDCADIFSVHVATQYINNPLLTLRKSF